MSRFFSQLKYALSNPLTVVYYIQGHVNWFIHGKAILKWYKKSLECPECFKRGTCIHCGCPFNEKALSDKPCGIQKTLISVQ